MDNITIRLEQTSDYRETEEVVREAFWNVYSPGCTEHYLLHTMRGSSGFVRELDFVAESGGRIIGAAVSQKGYILGDDGNRYGVLTLGPIAVLPSFQHRGTGRALIEHTRAAAADKGYRAILLCGDPEYYRNAGFIAAEHYGIRTSGNRYAAALQACPLYRNALQGLAGRYFEDDIYLVDEAKAALFDKQFPPKEMLSGTPSHQRFKEVSAMVKEYPGKYF